MRKAFFLKKIKELSVIGPNKVLLRKVIDAVDLIKKVDQKEYDRLFNRLNIIFITNKNGYTNEFFMPEKIWFVNKSVITKNDLNWLASLIIHEAFHSTQFKNGEYVLPFGEELEKPALASQKKFLKKTGDLEGEKQVESEFKREYWLEMDGDKYSYAYFRNLLLLLESNKLVIKEVKFK